MGRAGRWLLIAGKVAVSAALLFYLVRASDTGLVSAVTASMQIHVVVVALLAFGAVFTVHALRWRKLTSLAGSSITFAQALSLTWIGYFFNQLLPTSLGGDAVRIWYARNASMNVERAAAAVISERAFGVCGLAVVIASLAPAISPSGDRLLVLGIAMACLLATAAFAAAAPLFSRYRVLALLALSARLLREALRDRAAAVLVIATTLLAHLLCVLVGYIVVDTLSARPPAVEFTVAFLTALLVSTLPISYAGWGLREAAMVYFLGSAGVDARTALTVSVSFGVLLAIASVPGAVLWIVRTRSGVR